MFFRALSLRWLRISSLLALALFVSGALHAQLVNNPGMSQGGVSQLPHDPDAFSESPALRHHLERSRAADRQRRIVDDANRLVALTAEYQRALDAHGAPTEDDQKLLVQIEKLARDVKDRMRGM